VAAALWFTAAAATFAASAHMGTWKLNEAKSKFAPGATKNTTVTYTAAKDDMIMLTVHGVDKDGKAVHWTWMGTFDGQPYKVEGNAAVNTFGVKIANDHMNDTTGMKDGKVVMTGVITVSKDGKSSTATTTMTNAEGEKRTDMAYYDKE
jgi:uncharacterized Ntn-hydrolase superfamily protein